MSVLLGWACKLSGVCRALAMHSSTYSHEVCCNRYKHVSGVIHIKRDDLLLKHRPWHTMLRSSVGDHSMMKYSSGIYKHMPGGLESLPSFFAPKPVTKLCETICKASCKRGRVSSQQSDTGTSHTCYTAARVSSSAALMLLYV